MLKAEPTGNTRKEITERMIEIPTEPPSGRIVIRIPAEPSDPPTRRILIIVVRDFRHITRANTRGQESAADLF